MPGFAQEFAPVEGDLRDWLRTIARLTGLLPPATHGVYVGVPRHPIFPLIALQRVGGAPTATDLALDQPLVQFDVWGESDEAAADAANVPAGSRGRSGAEKIAATLASVAASLSPGTPAGGIVLLGGAVTLGPIPRPDPDTDRPRYEVDVQFTARAVATA